MPSDSKNSQKIPALNAAPPSQPLVMCSLNDLRLLLVEVSEILLHHEPEPRLLDRGGIAKALGISVSQVDKLRARGMPSLRLGAASERYAVDECIAWIRANPAPAVEGN